MNKKNESVDSYESNEEDSRDGELDKSLEEETDEWDDSKADSILY
jgi:hypothetical protein